MSGHSKWSTIKRKKGALDAKRGKIFSRIVKEITVAVKEGGSSDPEANPKLRLAIQNAKGVNMPKDNIERAISKANKDATSFEESTFEGYAPGGIAVFIECLSDNSNRTVSAVRAVFNKHNGSLGTNGSLGFLFARKGVFEIEKDKVSLEAEEFELELIDAGLEEMETADDLIILSCDMEAFGAMQAKLDDLQIEVANAELRRVPNDTKELELNQALKVMRMIDAFEDVDDVSQVFHNLEMTEELENALSEE